MSFPATFPGACPLVGARDCDLTVYMAVKKTPVTAQQCLTQAERGRAAHAIGDDACKRHGLSVFPTAEDCLHQIELFPWIGQCVTAAQLEPSHGVYLETPAKLPSHLTWWPYEGVERHTLFVATEGV